MYRVHMTLDIDIKTNSEHIQQLLDLIGECISKNISENTVAGTVVEITPKITKVEIENGEK